MLNKNINGFATLIAVLVTGAIGTVILLATMQLGFGATHNSLLYQRQAQAKMLADACVEKVLNELTVPYTGSQNISLGLGNCAVTVTGATLPKTIEATGTVDNITQKVTLIVTAISPSIEITDWSYVSSF